MTCVCILQTMLLTNQAPITNPIMDTKTETLDINALSNLPTIIYNQKDIMYSISKMKLKI